MQNLVVIAALTATLALEARPGAAQPADSKAAAEQLFNQGRALMAQGDVAAACPKFEASLKLDPAVGTLINLAHCYEQSGRLASAWARYREVAALAARAGQSKREAFARERAAALEPRLPRLGIRVAAPVPDLRVLRDGAAVDGALLNTAVYVDPGDHTVTATAPGHAPFETTVTAIEAQEVEVEVPSLAPADEGGVALGAPVGPLGHGGHDATHGAGPAPEPASGAASPAALRAHTAPRADAARLHADAAQPMGRTRRILGLTTGGVGLAALAAGLGVGWTAVSTWEDAFDQGLCDRDTRLCTPEGQTQADTARSRVTLSNVLVGAGVALAATGVALYLTAPEAEPAARRARLVPVVGPEGLGLAVAGGF